MQSPAVDGVDVGTREGLGPGADRERHLPPFDPGQAAQHGASPAAVEAEGRVEDLDLAGPQAVEPGDQVAGDIGRIRTPGSSARPRVAGGAVILAAAAEVDAEAGQPGRRVRIAGVVGQRRGGERQRFAGADAADAGLAAGVCRVARDLGQGDLGLALDDPVEHAGDGGEVVGPHRRVVAEGGDRHVAAVAPQAPGEGDGGAVLQRAQAGEGDQVGVGAALAEQVAGARRPVVDLVGRRVAALDLEVEHGGHGAAAPQMAPDADQLGLDRRPVGPPSPVQRRREHDEDPRLGHDTVSFREAAATFGGASRRRLHRVCALTRREKRDRATGDARSTSAPRDRNPVPLGDHPHEQHDRYGETDHDRELGQDPAPARQAAEPQLGRDRRGPTPLGEEPVADHAPDAHIPTDHGQWDEHEQQDEVDPGRRRDDDGREQRGREQRRHDRADQPEPHVDDTTGDVALGTRTVAALWPAHKGGVRHVCGSGRCLVHHLLLTPGSRANAASRDSS